MRSNGRRGAIDWAATSHDGDAASAATDVDAWLAERSAPSRDADWERVLGGLRGGMQQLMSTRLVQQDAVCREVLAGLDRRSSLADLDAAMEALGHRLTALLQPAGIAPPPKAPEPVAVPGARKAGSLRSFLRL